MYPSCIKTLLVYREIKTVQTLRLHYAVHSSIHGLCGAGNAHNLQRFTCIFDEQRPKMYNTPRHSSESAPGLAKVHRVLALPRFLPTRSRQLSPASKRSTKALRVFLGRATLLLTAEVAPAQRLRPSIVGVNSARSSTSRPRLVDFRAKRDLAKTAQGGGWGQRWPG